MEYLDRVKRESIALEGGRGKGGSFLVEFGWGVPRKMEEFTLGTPVSRYMLVNFNCQLVTT